MKKYLLLLTLLFLAAPAQAQQARAVFSVKDVEKWGVFARTFAPIAFIDEEKLFIGVDNPPFTVKRKGIMQRLWLVKLDANFKVDSVREIDLKLGGALEQAKLSPDLKDLILVSRRGTQVDKLNLADSKITNVMSHTPGQAGFRLDPYVAFSAGNNFYVTGYPYDDQDFGGKAAIAKLDLTRTGAAAFEPQVELLKLDNGVPNATNRSFNSPEAIFFFHKTGEDENSVTRWTPNAGYQLFDKGKRSLGCWGAQQYILYGMTRADGTHDLVWGNGKTGEKKILATGPNRYLNPVLSHEGNAWVAMEEESPGFYTIVAGSDRDPALKKLVTHSPGGALRVGTQGETIVVHGLKGDLSLFQIP